MLACSRRLDCGEQRNAARGAIGSLRGKTGREAKPLLVFFFFFSRAPQTERLEDARDMFTNTKYV